MMLKIASFAVKLEETKKKNWKPVLLLAMRSAWYLVMNSNIKDRLRNFLKFAILGVFMSGKARGLIILRNGLQKSMK